MLNVNDGHNPELMEHCRTLKEYAQYVAKVRKYAAKQNVSLESAMTQAVDECIAEGILADFLLKNKTEVIKVSIYEYDKEFPQYLFAKHKGYGTKAHIEALLKYGPCKYHRPSFLKKIYNKK